LEQAKQALEAELNHSGMEKKALEECRGERNEEFFINI
jgi:hypothetical protein